MSLLLLILVFTVCGVLGCCNYHRWSQESLSVYLLIGLFLIVAATLRPSYMPDYKSYVEGIIDNHGSERLEVSFFIFKFIGRFLGGNPFGTFFLYALSGTGIVLYTIRRDSRFVWFSVLLFVSIYFILGEMIQIRQAVAIGIFLYSIPFIYFKQVKKYFVTAFTAIMFHYSAVIMIPLYFLSPKNHDHKPFIVAIFICFIIGLIIDFQSIVNLLNIDLVSKLYYIKTANQNIESIPPIYANIRFLIQIFICLFFWYYIEELQRYNKYSILYLKLYSIGLSIFLLFYNITDLADRLSTMFLTVEIMLIPMVIKVVRPSWISKTLIIVIGLKYFSSSISTYLLHG